MTEQCRNHGVKESPADGKNTSFIVANHHETQQKKKKKAKGKGSMSKQGNFARQVKLF